MIRKCSEIRMKYSFRLNTHSFQSKVLDCYKLKYRNFNMLMVRYSLYCVILLIDLSE